MSPLLRYIAAYPPALQQQVQRLLDAQRLGEHLLARYPEPHAVVNDRQLRDYVVTLQARHLKQSPTLSKVVYDGAIQRVEQALGLYAQVTRVQGGKLKRKNEIRISTLFKRAPEALLQMIVVHELAHLREREHNKRFYQLCTHMLADYHQLEFDARLYLIQLETGGPLY